MTTYLLIQAEAGRVEEAATILRAAGPADWIEIVQGAYDIIACAEDIESEKHLMNRCVGSPFIRVLPCRTGSVRPDEYR